MGPTKVAIAKMEPEPYNGVTVVAEPPPTIFTVIREAIRQNVDINSLTKLFELRERELAREAKAAYDAAFAAFQAEAPKLEKTKTADFGQGKAKYKWAPLDEIGDALRPILAKQGLSYSWTQSQSADGITVTCTLKHVHGHFETNTLTGPPDDSGSKNKVQAISSGTSYLRRYTVLGVTGMATADGDTDGNVTMNEAADFVALIEDSRTIDELKKHYQEAVSDGLKKQSSKAVDLYMKARQKREAELRG